MKRSDTERGVAEGGEPIIEEGPNGTSFELDYGTGYNMAEWTNIVARYRALGSSLTSLHLSGITLTSESDEKYFDFPIADLPTSLQHLNISGSNLSLSLESCIALQRYTNFSSLILNEYINTAHVNSLLISLKSLKSLTFLDLRDLEIHGDSVISFANYIETVGEGDIKPAKLDVILGIPSLKEEDLWIDVSTNLATKFHTLCIAGDPQTDIGMGNPDADSLPVNHNEYRLVLVGSDHHPNNIGKIIRHWSSLSSLHIKHTAELVSGVLDEIFTKEESEKNKQFPKLHNISLLGCGMSSYDVPGVLSRINRPSATSFNFSYNGHLKLEEYSVHLHMLPHLTALILQHNKIASYNAETWTAIAQALPNLQTLDLRNNPITTDSQAIQTIRQLFSNRQAFALIAE